MSQIELFPALNKLPLGEPPEQVSLFSLTPPGVLCVVAHPDDEVIGCGATLARHATEGSDVRVLIIGSGRAVSESLNIGASDEAAVELGVRQVRIDHPFTVDQEFDRTPFIMFVKTIEAALVELRPAIIYTHWIGDRNLDHQIVARAVLTAVRPDNNALSPGNSVRRVLMFPTLSSTEWADPGMEFRPNVFVRINEDEAARKEAALKAYAHEMKDWPHPRSVRNIQMKLSTVGSVIAEERAEEFYLVREIL